MLFHYHWLGALGYPLSSKHKKRSDLSRGFVNLTGPGPQDPLNIQKLRFQAAQGPQDVADLREALKRARGIIGGLTVSPWIEGETSPGSRVQTDDEIDEYIYENVFGRWRPVCLSLAEYSLMIGRPLV